MENLKKQVENSKQTISLWKDFAPNCKRFTSENEFIDLLNSGARILNFNNSFIKKPHNYTHRAIYWGVLIECSTENPIYEI